MRIRCLFILLFLYAGLLQSQHSKIIEIKTDRNGNLDLQSIDQLKQDLQQADIILLGETIHTPIYYPSKIQLVKYLHKNLGFDVLAFESGLYEMERVNRDIAEDSTQKN
jgi:erythromycin esterase